MGDDSDFSSDESAVSASESVAVHVRAQHLAIEAVSPVVGLDAGSVRAARALAESHVEDSPSLQRPQGLARGPSAAEDAISVSHAGALCAQEDPVAALQVSRNQRMPVASTANAGAALPRTAAAGAERPSTPLWRC